MAALSLILFPQKVRMSKWNAFSKRGRAKPTVNQAKCHVRNERKERASESIQLVARWNTTKRVVFLALSAPNVKSWNS
jgi:hypothetical protein